MNSSRKLGWFLASMLTPIFSSLAVTVNDGSTTNNLTQIFNSSTKSQGDPVSAIVSLQVANCPSNCALTAVQTGESGVFALRSTWYANDVAPTSGVYTVSARFEPDKAANENRGGVMGWLSLSASNGISLQVVPENGFFEDPKSFRVSVVDFSADNVDNNESLAHLFDTNGTPAGTNSAWSELGTNYFATNFATFQLEFSAPTAADLAALTNATTARITARVFQGTETSGTLIQVSRTVELLTDLPLPAPDNHRIGYYAVWATTSGEGVIGYLDNLTATNVTAVSSEPVTPPTLSIALTSGAVQISWPVDYTSYQLASSPNLATNSWTTVATTNNRYTAEATNSARFFRLVKP